MNYEQGEVKNIHYGDVLVKYGAFVNVAYDIIPHITNSNANDYQDRFLQDGDLVFADTAEDETTGKAVEITNVQNCNIVSGLHTIAYRPSDKFAPYFLGYYSNSQSFRKQLMPLMQGIKVLSLSKSNISKALLIFPTDTAEQTAIGNFFRTLDNAITLRQRKLDGLRELKRGYLQLMFPQAGERVPRVRFAGFGGEWQKRRLGDVVIKLKSYALSRDFETKEKKGYRYIHYGDIHKQVADLITKDEQLPCIRTGDYMPLNQGDLILADASEDYTGIAEPSVIIHNPTDKIIAGLHTIAMRPHNADPLYLYYLLHTNVFKKFGGHVGTGLKVFGITFKNLSSFETAIPTLAEQAAIGELFRIFDTQIAVQSHKMEQLIHLKTAYLQRMFV